MIELGFLDLALLAYACYWLGGKVTEWRFKSGARDLFDELGVSDDQVEEVMDKMERRKIGTVTIRLEHVGGIIYAYNDDTDEFMAQHQDQEELFKLIAERFGQGTYKVVDTKSN